MNFGGEEGVGEGGGKGGKKNVSLKLMFFSPSLLPALKSVRCPSLAGEFWGLKEGVDSNGVWRAPIMRDFNGTKEPVAMGSITTYPTGTGSGLAVECGLCSSDADKKPHQSFGEWGDAGQQQRALCPHSTWHS